MYRPEKKVNSVVYGYDELLICDRLKRKYFEPYSANKHDIENTGVPDDQSVLIFKT